MEWQVGQWAVYRCEPAKIEKVDNALTVRFANGSSIRLSLDTEFLKPFAWQVGKTYRTTLEGVTGKVLSIDDKGDIYGNVMGQPLILANYWHAKTGKDFNEQRGADLLPFLADEPSDETTLTERYAVGQLGTLWGVFDRLTNQFARCENRELSEAILRDIGIQELDLDWWQVTEADLPGQSPSTQPKSRYHRTIKGVTIDLYDIAKAYGVKGNAEFHAMKKIIMAGDRGYKDRDQDLAEAIVSIKRAIELAKGGA